MILKISAAKVRVKREQTGKGQSSEWNKYKRVG